jgi:hypothetical protein
MRVRDIGWDPVCVLPGWFALLVVDKIIATNIPAWALDSQHHGTLVGAVVNFGLMLALTFWPSGDPDGPAFDQASHAAAQPRPGFTGGQPHRARHQRRIRPPHRLTPQIRYSAPSIT